MMRTVLCMAKAHYTTRAVRNIAINIGLLVGTIILFFVGMETVLRASGLVAMKDYTPPIYENHSNPNLNYVLKPNIKEQAFRSTIRTNSLGFRSEELQPDKPVIALIGDSITFGYGVEDDETLGTSLSALLPDYNILNAGTPGYNIRQEAALYREKIQPLNPAAIIVVFYWNDFDLSPSFLDTNGVLRPEGWKGDAHECQPIERGILGLIPGRCFLDTKSALYKVVKEYLNTRTAIRERDVQREAEIKSPEDPVTQDDLRNYEREFDTLAAVLPKEMPKLFVIWPDSLTHEASRQILRQIAKRRGFAILDLYETFGNTMKTLSWDYIHPHPHTLAEAAEEIHNVLFPLLP